METKPAENQYDTLNLLQFIFEIAVIVGYVIAIIPGMYFVTFLWVVPLAVANLVFSIIKENDTLPYTSTNVAMSLITFLPIVGYLSIIAGIVMSVLSALKVSKIMQINPSKGSKPAAGKTVEAVAAKSKPTKEVEVDAEDSAEKPAKEDKTKAKKDDQPEKPAKADKTEDK